MAEVISMDDLDVVERRTAARSGDCEAMYDLGIMYSLGQSVGVDLVEAHKWFNLAVLRGLNWAKDNRAEVAMEMSAGEIASAQKLAREWLAQA
jgi:uncharacterized protein